jgi:hypothetical protein
MGRLKKGISIFRDVPHELDPDPRARKNPDGSPIGYRHIVVDWLNRALSGTTADRDAAERIGALVQRMNQSAARSVDFDRNRISLFGVDGASEHAPNPRIELLDEIAASYSYRLEPNLIPPMMGDGNKWQLLIHCTGTPSGELGSQKLGTRIEGEDACCNPECLVVEMIIMIAIDGQLGTIRRCEVCSRWFLTKADPRVRCCPDHDVDNLRKGTPVRNKQLAAAAKTRRKNEKEDDQKSWKQLTKDGFSKAPRRREV